MNAVIIFPDSPYALAMMATAIIAAVLAGYVWKRRSSPGGLYFSVLMAAVAEWTFFNSLEVAVADLPGKVLCAKLSYISLVSIGPLFLLFALDYSRKKQSLARDRTMLLWIVPAALLAFVATNEWHGLMWSKVYLTPDFWGGRAVYEYGPVFWVHATYAYLLGVAGALVLVATALRSSRRRRAQTAALLTGIPVAIVGSAIIIASQKSIASADIVPFAYAITGVLYGVFILGDRLFDIVPVAREQIIASMADGVLVLDKEGLVVDMNPAARRMTGADSGAIGLPVEEAMAMHPGIKQCLESEAGMPAEVRLKSGDVDRWLDVRASPLQDRRESPTGRLIVLRDITEHKQADEAVLESEGRFKAIFEGAGMAIAAADQAGRIQDCNAAFEKMLGYRKEELLGKPFLDFTHMDDACNNRDLFQKAIEGQIDSYQLEKRFIQKDGRPILCSLNASFIRDADGKLKYNLAIIEDITRRGQAEKDLKTAKLQAELYLDLMGHDINNMHQIALGYLEMARDMQVSKGLAEFLDKPIEALQRSARLIQNVSKLQKLQEGSFSTREVDVCAVLADVLREFGAANDKSVTLNLNGHEHCYVTGNELLNDVFANLVSNAIKHTGGHADIVIDMDVARDDGCKYYRVSIVDNGPGIPDSFKGQIFNRMLKGTSQAKGMGLGLYLVKSLVESYEGRVWVEDRVPGDHAKGAKFVVMLPVAGMRGDS